MRVRPSARGTFTLLKELRADWDQNTLLDVVKRPDGLIELRPQKVRDAAVAKWEKYWERVEQEADEDYAAGRYKSFDDIDSFTADLENRDKRNSSAPLTSTMSSIG